MNKPPLDLETLEVEKLDLTTTGPGKEGLESLRMGHAATELSQSCKGDLCDTSSSYCGTSGSSCDLCCD